VLERRAAALAADIARRPKEACSEEYARALFATVCVEIQGGASRSGAFEACVIEHDLPKQAFNTDRDLRKIFDLAFVTADFSAAYDQISYDKCASGGDSDGGDDDGDDSQQLARRGPAMRKAPKENDRRCNPLQPPSQPLPNPFPIARTLAHAPLHWHCVTPLTIT
jgi:hypothetical protein